MFIWDFVAGEVLGQIVDWFYGKIVGFLGNFFSEMGNMGAELFTMDWVQSIVLLFSYLAWALYGTGLVVACFETGVEYSSGRGNIREAALNAIKGFMAVSLFSTVPVRLYELCVSLQGTFTAALTGYGSSIGDVAGEVMQEFNAVDSLTDLTAGPLLGFGTITSGIMILFCLILMAYAVVKVFFANLKRGGILLIQIAVGSLYMFSVLAATRMGLSNGASRSSACACRHSCRPPFLLQDSWYLRTMPCWVWGLCSLPVRSPVSPEPLGWIPPPKQTS